MSSCISGNSFGHQTSHDAASFKAAGNCKNLCLSLALVGYLTCALQVKWKGNLSEIFFFLLKYLDTDKIKMRHKVKYLDTDKIKMRHKVTKSKLNLFDGLSLQWFSQGWVAPILCEESTMVMILSRPPEIAEIGMLHHLWSDCQWL